MMRWITEFARNEIARVVREEMRDVRDFRRSVNPSAERG